MVVYILLAIVFTIFFISYFAYFSVTHIIKERRKKFSNYHKFKDLSIYEVILNELGTIKNIEKIQNQKIFVFSELLINKEKLKKLCIKVKIENKIVLLQSNNFSIKLFLNKLNLELKKIKA